jgi:hypothetical protein
MCTDVAVKVLHLAIIMMVLAGFSEVPLRIQRTAVCNVIFCSYIVKSVFVGICKVYNLSYQYNAVCHQARNRSGPRMQGIHLIL